MTIQTTRKTLTLPPALNALAVIAQSSHDLLLEVEKVKEVYTQHVKESQETITSQAQENQKLKAELESLKELHAREVEVLKGQIAYLNRCETQLQGMMVERQQVIDAQKGEIAYLQRCEAQLQGIVAYQYRCEAQLQSRVADLKASKISKHKRSKVLGIL
jgi:hypothetical protein